MKNPAFLHVCENKGADQMRGKHTADQRLYFIDKSYNPSTS